MESRTGSVYYLKREGTVFCLLSDVRAGTHRMLLLLALLQLLLTLLIHAFGVGNV